MRSKVQFLVCVVGFILLFDAVASFASRSLRFDYTSLAWVSWCLYVLFGFLGCRYHGFAGGVMAGIVAGITDSTVGWLLELTIKPYVPFKPPPYSLPLILITIIIVSFQGLFFGLIGALLGLLFKKVRKTADA
jgi:Na+/proline symporter